MNFAVDRPLQPITPTETLLGFVTMVRCLLLLLFVLTPLLTLTGCNAVKGFGKDIHDATQNVQEWIEGGNQNSRHIKPS